MSPSNIQNFSVPGIKSLNIHIFLSIYIKYIMLVLHVVFMKIAAQGFTYKAQIQRREVSMRGK